MRRSTTSFLFPDVNVWVALTHGAHVHHLIARDWFESLDDGTHFSFCRFTQLGLLRLLTAEAVMGEDVLSQAGAWAVYDSWTRDDRVIYLEEPVGLDRRFRSLSRMKQAAPKQWADSYLMAFAETASLSLVTFDRGLRRRTQNLTLLEA